jgi:pimeloyl-ACP methyl ester carboxylesterase
MSPPPPPLLLLLLLARTAVLVLGAAQQAVVESTVPLLPGGANVTLFLPPNLRVKPPLVLILRGLCPHEAFDAPFARAAAVELRAVTALLSAPRNASCSACSATAMAHGGAPAAASPAPATPASCPAWDAIEACCQDAPRPGGDVAFVLGAIDAIARAAHAGPVHVIGFSAGAFMALRLACDAPARRLAGVVAYAGAAGPDQDDAAAAAGAWRCKPAAPLPLQMLHARGDQQVAFGGGAGSRPGTRYAAADATLLAWARHNRCAAKPRPSPPSPLPVVLPPPSADAPAPASSQANLTRVLFADCAAPTSGWWVDGWGHFPLPQQSTALFLRALKTNMHMRA